MKTRQNENNVNNYYNLVKYDEWGRMKLKKHFRMPCTAVDTSMFVI